MSTATKRQGRRPRVKKDDSETTTTISTTTESATQPLPQNIESQTTHEAPVITNWSRESNVEQNEEEISEDEETTETRTFIKRKSVMDFDRNEIATYEGKKVAELTVNDLLKVLIKRGEDQTNPIVSGGCERLLKQINRERIGRRPMRHNNFNQDDNAGGNQRFSNDTGVNGGNQRFQNDNFRYRGGRGFRRNHFRDNDFRGDFKERRTNQEPPSRD